MKSFILVISLFSLIYSEELNLHELQSQMFENNFELKMNSHLIQKREAEIRDSKSAYLPSVDLNGSYTYLTEKSTLNASPLRLNNIPTTDNDKLELGGDVNWAIFTGFARKNSVSEKRAALKASKELSQSLKNRLSFQLALSYFRHNLIQKQIEAQKVLVQNLEQLNKTTHDQYQAGIISQAKVLDTESKVAFNISELSFLQLQLDSVYNEIRNMVQVKDSFTIAQSIDTIFVSQIKKEYLHIEIDSSRSDIQAISYTNDQLAYAKEIINSKRYPMVSVFAGYRYADPGLQIGRTGFMGYGIFGGIIKWNIYDGGSIRARKEGIEQQIKYNATEREFRLVQYQTSLNYNKNKLNQIEQTIEAAQKALSAAQKLSSELKNSFESGVITLSDYLSAITNETKANFALEQAKFNYNITIVSIYYNAGKNLSF